MDTLLIRLVAPMQSWGIQSHYTVRDTAMEPSKSGVIGLLCAALGRPRDAALDDLSVLRMGVRVDRQGELRRDYHIAQDVLDSGGKTTRPSIVTNRYYLADAAFLVGLEGQRDLLVQLHAALRHPVWALYLGRKAFTPSAPVYLRDGLREDAPLEVALREYGWIIRPNGRETPQTVRITLETPHGSIVRPDVPLSFAERRFSTRQVEMGFQPAPGAVSMEVA